MHTCQQPMADARTKAAPGFKLCTNINCKDSNNERTQIGVKTKQCPHCREEQIRRGRRLQYAETADSLAIGGKRAHVSNKAKPQRKRVVNASSQLPSTSSPRGDEPPEPASSRDHAGPGDGNMRICRYQIGKCKLRLVFVCKCRAMCGTGAASAGTSWSNSWSSTFRS